MVHSRVVFIAAVVSIGAFSADAAPVEPATSAQGSNVTGTVYDSIGGRGLPGASVQIVGAADPVLGRRFTAVSDSTGRFSIANVAAGQYIAGFQHPRLDSLGLEMEEQVVMVSPSGLRLDLATPSPATFIALVCPDDQRGSLLVGHVRETGNDTPLATATVTATWSELDTTNVFAAQRTRERSMRTTPNGWFALCGLPGDIAVLARGMTTTDSSGYVRVSVPATAVRIATFHVGGAERTTVPIDDAPGAAPQVVWRGESELSGVIRDDRGQPMPNALVTVWGTTAEGTTDSRGRFRLSGLPGGTQTVEARAIGFQPVERAVTLTPDRAAQLDLALGSRVTELEGVRVVAGGNRARLGAFYDRMRDAERGINHGYFITPEEMERRKPTLVTNVLEGLAGVRIIRESLDPRSAVIRGSMKQNHTSYCVMTVYLDGVRVYGSGSGNYDMVNMLIDPATVAAIEVYPRPVSAPPRYQSLNGTCGVVLIWTK